MLNNKSRKKELSNNFLDNNNTYIFIKKELGYLYIHLNKQ